eukprot:scaffold93173_cov15-Tisochrysis_lutea.AAC.1
MQPPPPPQAVQTLAGCCPAQTGGRSAASFLSAGCGCVGALSKAISAATACCRLFAAGGVCGGEGRMLGDTAGPGASSMAVRGVLGCAGVGVNACEHE